MPALRWEVFTLRQNGSGNDYGSRNWPGPRRYQEFTNPRTKIHMQGKRTCKLWDNFAWKLKLSVRQSALLGELFFSIHVASAGKNLSVGICEIKIQQQVGQGLKTVR